MNFWYVLGIVLLLLFIYILVNYFINRKAVTELSQDEFQQGLRRAQVIDLREKADYDYGHIIGARNIPMSIFRTRMLGLRKDQPIYFVDANGISSYRAARMMKKHGYNDIYMLKNGYKGWTGKIKSK
ncbi:rhodanese-like domain-containing protein [Macrococcoides caseolyticum]|uniref:Rhodanese-like domain-containing protein n=1 Tax=Macrococcus psychrotolerans TaxID=3039389 RepID=A0AAT9P4V2_9STAP|nr:MULTISPECIES: rhodanese-like domain-containing protein [Macrococcus]MBQ5151845.1 rhodanese-like domain-containing protein [Macrococcus caseolyticus]MDJ1111271.1 rhodanese-like domain-containing protein [Macrococcus sp. S115]QYA31950.1 rhodanese-like domain-containing protein [Macrococcus sp. 19Msa1099]QYA36756.1 rhodanese-like domain-containing protein [Macrococcus caseolyticus]QYA75464.1 rhodanese-like domain-containing protein [Macrococcus caseolyticus]